MLGDGIRRNIATVSKEERDRFVKAILAMGQKLYPGNKNDPIPGGVSYWFKQDEIHDSTHVHFCPAFLPWHRELINRFEASLREIDPELSLHYWDWTVDPSNAPDGLGGFVNLFTPDFMGNAIGPGSSEIEIGEPWKSAVFYGGPGPYRGNPADPPQTVTRQVGVNAPLINPADEQTLLSAPDFVAFDDQMEGSGVNLHGQGHGYVGGTLLDPHTSFRDPFVFLLHCNIDRLFAMWQRQSGHKERLDPAQLYKAQSTGRNGYENTKGGDRTTIDPPGVSNPGDNNVQSLHPWWGILSPEEPWAGPGATVQTAATGIINNVNSVRPWAPPENQQIFKDSRDPSIIIPASYDTVPHSSYMISNQDTFSTSQVATLGSPATISKAFYVVYDGFEPKELGVTSSPLPAVPPNLPTFTFTGASGILAMNPSVSYEDPGGAIDVPQRITIFYDLVFVNSNDFPTTAGGEVFVNMRASLSYNVDTGTGGTVVSLNEIANTTLVLINQPNPYMIDVDSSLSPPNPSWLSMDTRVFQVKGPGNGNPAGTVVGVVQGDADSDPNAPFSFIQGVLGSLRGNPTLFESQFSEDENASVLELSRSVNSQRVYNYAIARVRYRAPLTVNATKVGVFFRGFNCLVSAIDYDNANPTTSTVGNYRRTGNSIGSVPLLGIELGQSGSVEIASIPFFAEARQANMALQTDSNNVRDINGNGSENVEFFGCWLDINQTDLRFPLNPLADPGNPNGPFTGTLPGNPLLSIQQLMRGQHECLAAEIFFWPPGTTNDPIPLHASPASSDRLAQRNISIVESGNPGWPETHTVQHTFIVRPSPTLTDQPGIAATITTKPAKHGKRAIQAAAEVAAVAEAAVGIRTFGPDELIIRWNNVPRNSTATFYFPEIDVDEILRLSALRQHPAVLSKADAHTLACKLADITFIPLPSGREGNMAGLMSVTLPPGVRTGQVYRLSVEQYSGITRKTLGAFQITIPVKTDQEMLPTEIRKLSVLRYIQQTIPTSSRWHSIFERYLDQIAARVRGLGVDPNTVKPSPDGCGLCPPEVCHHPEPDVCQPDLWCMNIPWKECDIEGEIDLKLRFKRKCK